MPHMTGTHERQSSNGTTTPSSGRRKGEYGLVATETPSAAITPQKSAAKTSNNDTARDAGAEPSASQDMSRTPLPWLQLAVVVAVQICEAFQITVVFPFLVFMIQDFGVAAHDVGFYAGTLAASFCTAQFISSPLWGWLSDRLGRRRTLLLGVTGACIAILVFGTATTFTQALIGRMLAGALNGNVGVLKAFLADITDTSNRAVAFSMLPTAWGVGVVVAPLAGGLLAKPADIFPGLRGTLLDRFPYLLPCLIGVVLQCCAIVFVLCVMQEPRRARQGFVRLDRQRGVAQAQGQAQGQAGVGEAPTPGSEEEQEGGVQMVRLVPEAAPAGAGTDLESGAAVESGSSMTAITNISSKPRASVRAVLCRRVVALSIGNYAMLALAYMVIDELLPLWFAAASIDFGLEFNSSEIGIFMVIQGVSLFVFTLFVYPWLSRRITLRQTLKWSALMSAPMFLLVPAIHWLLGGPAWILWLMLATVACLKMMLASAAFTAVMVMVNNSVPLQHVGAVNGLGQAAAALSRAIGPAGGGALFSLGERLQFPGHNFVAFALVAIMCVGAGLFVFMLPASLEQSPGQDDDDDENDGEEEA